jgi:hypothetical protein
MFGVIFFGGVISTGFIALQALHDPLSRSVLILILGFASGYGSAHADKWRHKRWPL